MTQEEKILEDLKTNYLPDVARKYNLQVNRVYSLWRKHNPVGQMSRTRVPRSQRATYPKRDQEIVKLRNLPQPMSFRKIGEKFSITKQRAEQIYRANRPLT